MGLMGPDFYTANSSVVRIGVFLHYCFFADLKFNVFCFKYLVYMSLFLYTYIHVPTIFIGVRWDSNSRRCPSAKRVCPWPAVDSKGRSRIHASLPACFRRRGARPELSPGRAGRDAPARVEDRASSGDVERRAWTGRIVAPRGPAAPPRR